MIRNIPSSLLEAAEKHLSEAVALKTHINMANKASRSTKVGGKTRAEAISQHVIPLGQDTTVLPLERSTATPHPDVVAHLEEHGYDVHDYIKGLAIKHGQTKNPISIGKVLARTDAPQSLKTTYEKDPNRQGVDSSVHVVISRNPVHVAGMSTHQNWESCQTLGGSGKYTDKEGNEQTLPKQDRGEQTKFVPEDIAAGSHIAYLVNKPEDIDKHYKPISRILLKPYISNHGHTVLRPMGVYGEEWNGFHSTVSKWANEHFPMKDAEYKLHDSVYPDGANKIYNFAPEHDEYWKKSSSSVVLTQHPSSEVIDHHIAEATKEIPGVSPEARFRTHTSHVFDEISSNPRIKEHHAVEILRHPNIKKSTKARLYSRMASDVVVGMGLSDPSAHEFVSMNPNLKTEHIDTLIHTYKPEFERAFNGESVPNHREVATTIHNLIDHPNLSRHQADELIQTEGITEYPSALAGLFHKASDDKVAKTLDQMNEEGDSNSWVYSDRAFATVAQKKPHLLPKLSNLMLLHAYNSHTANKDREGKGKITRGIEDEMLKRDDKFHHILARRSKNPEVLSHIITNSNKEEALTHARNNFDILTKKI